MKKLLLILAIATFYFPQIIQAQIPAAAFDNLSNTYNYTYWDSNFKTTGVAERSFTNQTSSYALNVNYTDLNINNLDITTSNVDACTAFAQPNSVLFPSANGGDIDFAILQNGSVLYSKSSTPTNAGNKDSQMAEYGTWLNRRFISTNLTNAAPVEFYFTGIEFTNWHNRFKVTFHVRPTVDIADGELQLSVEIPSVYNNTYQALPVYAFADGNDAGFAVKGGATAANTSLAGNTITVNTQAANLLANTSYEVSVVFYAIPSNLSTTYAQVPETESQINITANQTSPNTSGNSVVSYTADEGLHIIDIPRYGMGYTNCTQNEVLQNIEFSLDNTSNTDKVVRLCFRQIPSVNVVGFNSMIKNENGDPSGYPLQVSKNWHTGTSQLYSGSWIKEYTEIPVPANTTINFDYTRTGAKWGTTYGAFSHQLSVVGAGVPRGGWLEAGLGSFGETITHSPDYSYGNSNVCDYRPFLVTNQASGGTSSECNWTGNVGGMDMWIYENENNQRIYQSQVKTRFQRYSPNLTETSISAISSDEKLKLDYTFYLNRSDDFTRVYYKVKIKALDNVDFNRFDIFQLGGDNYNFHVAQSCAYGNESGMIGQFAPTNDGSNDYTTAAISLPGDNPWIWAGNGMYSGPNSSAIDIDTNNGMVVRSYTASFNGMSNDTPYFRERSSSTGFNASTGANPTSYCLVPPPSVTSFVAGDSVELILETMVLPKQAADYYGPNTNFAAALATYGNTVDLFLREVTGNSITISSPTNTVDNQYPPSVATNNNTAVVIIEGGKGFVPIRFTGLDNVDDPQLWRAIDDCWELVDQSTWGKDFWQADVDVKTGLFELVYNVDQDTPDDSSADIKYYLGPTPPEPNMVIQTQLYNANWTLNPIVSVSPNDSVIFAPQVTESGITSVGTGSWLWSGPNGYSANTRFINFEPVTYNDLGVYTCNYTDPYGCSTVQDFELTCDDLNTNGICDLLVIDDLELDIKVLLEGAYDSNGSLRADLTTLLPQQQPYTVAPYNYNGTETLSSLVGDEVDWILVELRTGSPNITGSKGTVTLATKAGILKTDGSIVGTDGNLLRFENLPEFSEFYICIRHRNHLDVLSGNPTFANNTNTVVAYDFTTNSSQALGNLQLKSSSDGFFMMYTGDYTQDGTIQTTDYDFWIGSPALLEVYDFSDGNLDGTVQTTDYDSWFNNKAKLGTVEIGF